MTISFNVTALIATAYLACHGVPPLVWTRSLHPDPRYWYGTRQYSPVVATTYGEAALSCRVSVSYGAT